MEQSGKVVTTAEIAKASKHSSKRRKKNPGPIDEADVEVTHVAPPDVRSTPIVVTADTTPDLAEIGITGRFLPLTFLIEFQSAEKR